MYWINNYGWQGKPCPSVVIQPHLGYQAIEMIPTLVMIIWAK